MKDKDLEQSAWFHSEILPHENDLRHWIGRRYPVIRDVDDILQEAFTRTLKAHQTGPIANPRAFLFVTTRNLILNQLRQYRYEHSGGTVEVDQISIVDEVSTPPESLANEEKLNHLILAIRSLPKRCRQIMTLRVVYGMSHKEIAEQLGITIHTVESQRSIGLRKCIAYFRKHGLVNTNKS